MIPIHVPPELGVRGPFQSIHFPTIQCLITFAMAQLFMKNPLQ
jgi:hypothetical protein